MTADQYKMLCARIAENDTRCGCCGVLLNHCVNWQMIRMLVDPLPGEDRSIDNNVKKK